MRVWRHDNISGKEFAQLRLGTSYNLEAYRALETGRKHAIQGKELHCAFPCVSGRTLVLLEQH
jgi:hypothetical protein